MPAASFTTGTNCIESLTLFPLGLNAVLLIESRTLAAFVLSSNVEFAAATPVLPARSVARSSNAYSPSGASVPSEAKPFQTIDSGGNSPKSYSFTETDGLSAA